VAIPDHIKKMLERKIGDKVIRRINPRTGMPFTEQEIEDMLKPGGGARQLTQGGAAGD